MKTKLILDLKMMVKSLQIASVIFLLGLCSCSRTPTEQSMDEIWYTTLSGQAIDMDEEHAKSYGIVSNKMYETFCVLKFDHILSEIPAELFAEHWGTSLTEIWLPNQVNTIGERAFANCTRLEKIHFPQELTKIDAGAFYCCTSLEEIDELPSNLRQIGNYTDSDVTLGTFENCRNIKYIVLPANVQYLGNYTFKGCSSLREFTLHQGLKYGKGLFYDCKNLTKLALADDAIITDSMCYGCTSLKNVQLPKGVDCIGDGAFEQCPAKPMIVRQMTKIPNGYVDLGLQSGTLWKNRNEIGQYDYQTAIRRFGKELPTFDEAKELLNSCEWRWNGNGYVVTGPNGNSITLAADGYFSFYGRPEYVGQAGYYWTSLPTEDHNYADILYFSPDKKCLSSFICNDKRSVRLTTSINALQDDLTHIIPEGYTDLGLPSGTIWKKENENSNLMVSFQSAKDRFEDIPTIGQLKELRNVCKWTWNGTGYKVTGPNGNSIVLPAESSKYGHSSSYWSSSVDESSKVWYLFFISQGAVEVDLGTYQTGKQRYLRLAKRWY